MLHSYFSKLDRKYVKIAAYAGGTCLITFFLGYLVWTSLPGLSSIGALLAAVMKPLTLGGVICYLLYPLVGFVQKKLEKPFPGKKWTRTIAVFAVVILIIALILVFLIIVSTTLVKQINVQSIVSLFESTQTDFESLLDQITMYLEKFNIKIPNIGSAASNLSGIVGSIASGTSTVFFGLIFAIYFLIDGTNISSYWKNVTEKLFRPKTIRTAKELLADADVCFSGYIRGQSMDAVLVGSVVSIVFSFMGMKYALVIGLLAGFGNLIPYVGPALGYIAVTFVNLMNWNIPMLIAGLVVLEIIMFIDGNVINPRLLAGTISIHPLLVIASLLAGGAIGGLLGMLLAVPVGAFLKLQFEKWLKRKEPPKDLEDA